jgi:transcriptional regulator with XRE-family HTH domain
MFLAQNIKHLRKLKKITQEQLSKAIGVERSNISKYESGDNEPPLKVAILIADFLKVSLEMLLNSDLSKLQQDTLLEVAPGKVLFPVAVSEKNEDLIEVIPNDVRASAGYLTESSNPAYFESLEQLRLPYSSEGKKRAFTIFGDSMPPVPSGSLVIGRFMDNLQQIKTGKCYIFITRNSEFLFKQAENRLKEENLFVLHSTNTFYPPINLPAESIAEAWEFVAYLSNQAPDTSNTTTEEIKKDLKEIKALLKK